MAEVPIWQTKPLSPLDYRTLSEGKITYYFPSLTMPNDPVQEATLEACRELPVSSATARSATVVIKTSSGDLPVSALVVGNTVLVSEGQVLRALIIPFRPEGLGTETLYPESAAGITFTPNSKWARVGKKNILLQQPVFRSSRYDLVITLHDLIAVFDERDIQQGGGHTIQSAQVSYDPNAK